MYAREKVSGEESLHGQVAMDFTLGGRMGDRTTVLRAHHMKDWSMFKAIVSLEEPEYRAAHPVVEFIYEGVRYTARWCAFLHGLSHSPHMPSFLAWALFDLGYCT